MLTNLPPTSSINTSLTRICTILHAIKQKETVLANHVLYKGKFNIVFQNKFEIKVFKQRIKFNLTLKSKQ